MDKKEEPAIFPKNPNKTYGLMELTKTKSFQIEKGPDNTVTSWPHLFFRELILFMGVFIALMTISLLFNAPLEQEANPSNTPNPAKAPWYFLGLQEMLSWAHPFWGGIFAPTVVVIILMLTPYFDRSQKGVGIWFAPERKIANLLFTIFLVLAVGLIVVGEFFRGPNWQLFWPWNMPSPH